MIVTVRVRGLREAMRDFRDAPEKLDRALRPAFERSATLIEGGAKRRVHKVTRKLAQSLGHRIEGHGPSLLARIGPQPGLGQPRGYTERDTAHWRRPRRGRNRGDPQQYGIFEEEGTRFRRGHPFMRPAVDESLARIDRVIADALDETFRR